MNLKKTALLLYFLISMISLSWAQQSASVKIQVLELGSDRPIPGASVRISEFSGSADLKGWITLRNVATGKHSLLIEAIGYQIFRDTITKFSNEDIQISVSLSKQVAHIEQVAVTGQSPNEKTKQAPIRSIYIDTRAQATHATSLTAIMNRSTGIRIRQNGAVGSRPDISINGFQGKAIKYFKDGIPMDFLGDGYNISSLPIEMLDHVEVYKGVLPVALGADALGGAINMVTDAKKTKQLKAYYEIGSFNSHRLGILASQLNKDQKWGYGAEAYFNYAKNNYKATVDVPNPETSNLEAKRLPMFHNAYKHYLAEVYASIRNRNWVDELKLSVIGFDLLKEQQHPALMTDAYGALHAKQNSIVPSIRYKINLLEDRLRIDQYASFNTLQTQRIDTLEGRYDWYGKFTPTGTLGESRMPSKAKVNEEQWITRSNLAYRLNAHNTLEFNYVFTHVDRSGTDPLGPRLQGSDIDVLSLTSSYRKQVFGLALENQLLGKKLQNQLIAKHYRYQAKGYQNTWFATGITENDKRDISGTFWGITEAIKYQLKPQTMIRASAEYTYRLPDREELFGNNVFVVPNFELNPEKSWNLNLGFQTQLGSDLKFEINSFYRNTDGLILLVPIQAPNAQYQNQEKVKGFGLDVDLSYSLFESYHLTANATWQDLRLFGIEKPVDTWKNDARLRNTPYFFANLGGTAKYQHVLAKEDDLQLFAHFNFTREFYLETIPKDLEPGGFLGLSGSADLSSNLIIPNQHLLNMGFNYSFLKTRMHIAGEVRNLLNRDIYDYYRIQRPGRSFHLKLSYQF